jgi:hypothetical protein
MPVCASEFSASDRANARGLNLQAQTFYFRRARDRQLQVATMVVLDERQNPAR